MPCGKCWKQSCALFEWASPTCAVFQYGLCIQRVLFRIWEASRDSNGYLHHDCARRASDWRQRSDGRCSGVLRAPYAESMQSMCTAHPAATMAQG